VETFDLRRSLERATGRNLERFFYDWLERPGNPELEVATEYFPESHQVRIVAKQIQKEEAFHIPIKLVLHSSCQSQPTVVEEQMTTKEMIKIVPLSDQLRRIDVDPDQAVLATIKETKSGDLWRAQLFEGPTVPLRIRALGHFAQILTDENRQLLAEAFSGEKFWGVQVELAKALGGARGNVARDSLLKGLRHSDARVRRVCVEQLGEFAGEGTVVSALKELLERGDPSYAVEAKALVAYAKMKQKDAVVLIKRWLSQPSHNDNLAIAALSALGIAGDSTAFQSLLEWTEPSHSFDARFAAREALVLLGTNQQLTKEQSQQVVENLRSAREQSEGSDRERIDDMIKRTLQKTSATAKTKSAGKMP
jgi:aminopeptidase N